MNLVFSRDWTGPLQHTIQTHLKHWIGRPCRYLEIGVFEGRGARYVIDNLLTHPESEYTGVDNWAQRKSNKIQKERAVANVGESGELIKEDSTQAMWDFLMQGRQFDIIYVDAGHEFDQALSDGLMAWSILAPGGVLFFDDWNHPKYKGLNKAIEAIAKIIGVREFFTTETQIGYRKPLVAKRDNRGEPEFMARSKTLVNPWPHIKESLSSRHMSGREFRPVEPVQFGEVRRNLLMHIWPVAGFGAWQWNCDQILKRRHLFNGRKVIAIVTDDVTDRPETVINYLRPLGAEFMVIRNDFMRREGITMVPLLSQVISEDPDEVTFYCHAKGVRHKMSPQSRESCIFQWTDSMWNVLLDYWPAIQEALERKAMCGMFRRLGQFRTPGNHRWFFSGSFYWFRNRDVFRRRWFHLDIHKFFGVESWPAHQFALDEVECLLGDDIHHLYEQAQWKSKCVPMLNEWKAKNAAHLTPQLQFAG